MRVKFKLQGVNGKLVELPLSYNGIVQGFIYNLLSRNVAKKVHDRGFVDKESQKSLKLFTFSRLIPDKKPLIKDGRIIFNSSFNLTVSSIYSDFIQSLAGNIVKANTLTIGESEVFVVSITVETMPNYREIVNIKTLSPIVVYSTLLTHNNKKKTYYYNPYEKEFSELLIKNLLRKSRVWFKREEKSDNCYIRAIKAKERVLMYKGTIIKGWDGIFELKLTPDLFTLAFETGLGSKNSQGFGCIEIYEG